MTEDFQKILEDHERRLLELESIFKKKPEMPLVKELSLKEFLLQLHPNTETQRLLCVASFLEKHKGIMPFNVKDLESGFRDAKEKVPENINYLVIRNIQQSFLMEAKEKKEGLKAWSLTASGERFVESLIKKGQENVN